MEDNLCLKILENSIIYIFFSNIYKKSKVKIEIVCLIVLFMRKF